MNRFTFLLLGLSLALAAPPAHAIDVLDAGVFEVYQGDHALGVENFAFERHSDSMYVHCQVLQKIPKPGGGEARLDKSVRLLTNGFDGGLVLYDSVQYLDGVKLVRAIVPRDTFMTVYREGSDGGEGDTIVRPPGRIFIIDPQVFTLFDVICRELGTRQFDQRRIQLFVLASRDTSVEATVTDMGHETIRWGAKPVQARKLKIADETSEFYALVGPQGYMLQLLQPATGLRVIRKGPKVKPPTMR